MHYAERELFRYTKGCVREHNLLKKQFVHTKFLLNPFFIHTLHMDLECLREMLIRHKNRAHTAVRTKRQKMNNNNSPT